jgi:hypothetical protein
VTAPTADEPIACTLEASAMPDRLSAWRAVLDRARTRSTTADGARRVEFGDDLDVGNLAELVAAEQRCCAFFSFAITVDSRGIGLEVTAPDDAAEVVDSLFGD